MNIGCKIFTPTAPLGNKSRFVIISNENKIKYYISRKGVAVPLDLSL